jgi:hypothetical protein
MPQSGQLISHREYRDARAQAAYGQHSQVGKILEIRTELPGRIHVVLIRQQVGY